MRATTRSVETKLAGTDPVRLDDDLLAIPVPGHTRGSTALLYKDEILFTGDHVWFSAEAGRLYAVPECLLVFVGRANSLDGALARLPFRVVDARTRSPLSSAVGRRHAQ